MTFRYPLLLLCLLVLIPLIIWYIYKHRNANAYLEVSTTAPFDEFGTTWKVYAIHALFVLRLLAIAALIVALARPQLKEGFTSSTVEGTDICIALDASGSMTATDITPSRFEAAKRVASSFINSRENDNMALVEFSGESLSLLPLTNDRTTLLQVLNNIQPGTLADGTAIGDGLTSAINRIVSGQAKSKSIILLTDGSNNAGTVAPLTATEIARQKGIRIYTIGLGTNGSITIRDPFGFPTTITTEIDEELLEKMAQQTGGKYFRATNRHMLEDVFAEIDTLEKTRMDVEHHTRTQECFMPWLWAALLLFGLEMTLRYTLLRRIP